jgi:hypothetical protein
MEEKKKRAGGILKRWVETSGALVSLGQQVAVERGSGCETVVLRKASSMVVDFERQRKCPPARRFPDSAYVSWQPCLVP